MNPIQFDLPKGPALLPGIDQQPSMDKGFVSRLEQAVQKVNDLQHTADTSAQKSVRGEIGIHEGMLAIQEADMSLRLMLQVRNKVLDAYREIMRMPG